LVFEQGRALAAQEAEAAAVQAVQAEQAVQEAQKQEQWALVAQQQRFLLSLLYVSQQNSDYF
jgi:hypothetical protein